MKKFTPISSGNCIILSVVLLIAAFTSCKKNNEVNNNLKVSDVLNQSFNSIDDGLIGYWPLQGYPGDMSGNGHTSTSTNTSTTTDHLGNISGAYYFNGIDSKMTVHDAADLRLYNTDYTICVWVRADSYNNKANSSILSKRSGSFSDVGGYMMGFSGESIVHGTSQTTGGFPRYYKGNPLITSDGPLTFGIGEWHHYIITYNLSTQTITEYFDGVLKNTYTGVTSPSNTSYPLTFGFDQASSLNGSYFEGGMSDIRIYNRVITSSEISQIYNYTEYPIKNEVDFTVNESSSPWIDANLTVKVSGAVVAHEYWSNSGTLGIPWFGVSEPPYGMPFIVEAYTQTASTASNPKLTLIVTKGILSPTTVFNQTIPAVPGANLTYNGIIYDYNEVYHITVTTFDGP